MSLLQKLLETEPASERYFQELQQLNSILLENSLTHARLLLLQQLHERLESIDPSQLGNMLPLLPTLLFFYLATPQSTPVNDEESSAGVFAEKLTTLTRLLESCFISWHKHLVVSIKTRNSPSQRHKIPIGLNKKSIYMRQSLQKESSDDGNIVDIIKHSLRDSGEHTLVDETVVEWTQATSPKVIESLLGNFERQAGILSLSQPYNIQTLFVFCCMAERLVCTDLNDTPVPLLPEPQLSVMEKFPFSLRSFYKQSLQLWAQCNCKATPANGHSPAGSPPALLPFRMTSLSSVISPSRTQSVSEGAKTQVKPVVQQPTGITVHTAFGPVFNSPSHQSPLAQTSMPQLGVPSPTLTQKISCSSNHKTSESTRLRKPVQHPVRFPPRPVVTRETMRSLLSILHLCLHVPTKFFGDAEEPISLDDALPVDNTDGETLHWQTLFPSLSDAELPSVAVTSSVSPSLVQRIRKPQLTQSTTTYSLGRQHTEVHSVTTASPDDPELNSCQALRFMAKRVMRQLMYRASIDQFWEIEMGARSSLDLYYRSTRTINVKSPISPPAR